MEDLLFSLCRICNIHEAKYTCPRCSVQTCSLPCSRRHKLWAECSGVRDPTVFKPKSQLATPSGIDHDYNFLHSIEHRIERSEKLIVEERGLVDKDELQLARADEEDQDRKRSKTGPQHSKEEPIQRSLQKSNTTIIRAPKGMRRNLENETTWSRGQRSIHWQVEWIREGDAGRILSKAMGKTPIGEVYGAIMEAERRNRLTDEEKLMEKKKRKATELAQQRLAKRPKSESTQIRDSLLLPYLQDPATGAWSVASAASSISNGSREPLPHQQSKPTLPSSHHLYLFRPRTPSCYPKVLVPLDPVQSLEVILTRRTVLEFPTIYILEIPPENLPEDRYMSERDFLKVTSKGLDTEMGEAKEESSSEEGSSDESDTSTSGSDEDEEMEDGEVVEEIVPKVWGRRR